MLPYWEWRAFGKNDRTRRRRLMKRPYGQPEGSFGLSDLPAVVFVRIAAKLEVLEDILSLRGSCAHARACLAAEDWAHLIVLRFGERGRLMLSELPKEKPRCVLAPA